MKVNSLVLTKRNIVIFGVLALLGAFVGVLADLFSAWSSSPNAMSTAISIDIESIRGLYLEKPRWTFILGNYLGVFFIPFHMFGFLMSMNEYLRSDHVGDACSKLPCGLDIPIDFHPG